jgi:hypothetical protein
MENNDQDYFPEIKFDEYSCNTNFLHVKVPSNSLDYMKFNSEDYLRYKFDNKVKEQIKELNLDSKLTKEICEYSFHYYKKVEKGVTLKIIDIINIVTYKLIKYYQIPISQNEILKILNLSKSKYLKYSTLIEVKKSFVEIKEDGIGKYFSELLQYSNYVIGKLIELYKCQPNILKMNLNHIDLTKYIQDFNKSNLMETSSNFFDIAKILEEVKNLLKNMLRVGDYDIDFFNFFHNKVLKESLVAALIKHFLDKNGIRINFSVFKENFNIPASSVSNAHKLLKEFEALQVKKDLYVKN